MQRDARLVLCGIPKGVVQDQGGKSQAIPISVRSLGHASKTTGPSGPGNSSPLSPRLVWELQYCTSTDSTNSTNSIINTRKKNTLDSIKMLHGKELVSFLTFSSVHPKLVFYPFL